jgi:hypothetical protein
MAPSTPAVIILESSGIQCIDRTLALCPFKFPRFSKVQVENIWIVLAWTAAKY